MKAIRNINLRRSIKYQYLKLLRSPGGAWKVAVGFAIGFGLEMLVPMTFMIIYVLIFLLVKLLRGSISAAIIGNIIGKLTILPVVLVPFAAMLGNSLLPLTHLTLPDYIYAYLKTLVGMSIFAAALGILSFFAAYYLYQMNQKLRIKRREKRKHMRTQLLEQS